MARRIILTLVLLALIGVGATSCGTIETGNVGVRTTLGKVAADEVEPGLYLGLPGISRVQEFSGKEIAIDLNDLTPKARDNLTRNAVYEQASRIDSLVMHTQRDELAAAVRKSLQAELDANDKGVFAVTRVVIRALTTDPAIERAIQESVAAQKQLETTKQRVAIAEAEAQVELKRAEGIAKANQTVNQSLTREYLQHESNLALQKFAEKGGTTTVVIPATMQTAPLITLNPQPSPGAK